MIQINHYTRVESFPNPMKLSEEIENLYVRDSETIVVDILANKNYETVTREYVRAGPRKVVLHDPKKVKV